MLKKLLSAMKPLVKPLFLFGLVAALALGHSDAALAARSGGRIGGGSFNRPAPSRPYTPPGGGGGGYYAPYPGGGFGFPFLLPFFGIGGFGSIFSILIFFAIANFLLQSFRRASSGGESGYDTGYNSNPNVSIAELQVGLLAQARGLQEDLNRIAETADTNSPAGRAAVLQEASLALLRHPEYWAYAGTRNGQARLNAAEAEFNRLSLAERSKFSEETLSNVNNQLRGRDSRGVLPSADQDNPTRLMTEGPGEYIVVTLLAATLGNFQMPQINSAEDLRQALRVLGAVPSDRLLAIEVLWTPQAAGDTLSSDDLLAKYADLKMV
jgi:uncharacterized membrane protein